MMARRRKGLRSLGSGFGESQLLKDFPQKRITPGDVSGCPAVKALTAATGSRRLNLGRISARLHGVIGPLLLSPADLLGSVTRRCWRRPGSPALRVSCNNVAY